MWAEGTDRMPPRQYIADHLHGCKLLPATVPAPVHQVLREVGLIEDPNLGLNSLRARWVEEQYWIYRHTFSAPAEAVSGPVWLVFEHLEICATVWLNGEELGSHANAHRRARFEVTDKLQAGENLIVVQVTAGLQEYADQPGGEYGATGISLLVKRPWQRKAQFQSGWDWSPRLMNVGILGDVRLEWTAGPRLDEVAVCALLSEDLTTARIVARATLANPAEAAVEGVLRARVVETGQEVAVAVTAAPGESRHEVCVTLENPRLWWPVGHGEQLLYHVEVTAEFAGETQTVTRRTGIRRVEVDQSAHPVTGRHFILKVNNRPIFCKGGNWVPPDLLFTTVSEERYRALVELAVQANFNTLRVWGGAVFAKELLEICDERGVLVWHDLLFACAKYPGDVPEFAAEVRREVTQATRELAHHPALIVWCGNNEIEWGDWAWGYDNAGRTHPHYALFHHDLPQIASAEAPAQFYWISSPYSPDYLHPNDPTAGDQHPWSVSMSPGGADWWAYRDFVDRFPNEGGVLGAVSPATLRQFLPEGEQELLSPSWDHHDNPFACTDSVAGNLGHAYQTVMLWTGRDPLAMDLDDYAFASALLQAEGLVEYVSNYRRRMFSSASAIFWMYNDSWPVTHGWTIVDYYLRRKLSYHPVRRANQPVSVVVAAEQDQVRVFGVNDSPQAWSGEVRWGLFGLSGALPQDTTQPATLAANAATLLAEFPQAEWDALGLETTGAFAVLWQQGALVAQHRLFRARFGDLRFATPEITIEVADGKATFTSPVFVWGVCLDPDGEAPYGDDCFDLLPGIPYSLPWETAWGEPQVARLGSRDLVAPTA
jgi:beta-mannosidase